ncbi:hypothetical protein, partial [Mammaliicoccus sp. P-M55]
TRCFMYKNYNMSQLTLPLDIEVLIPKNDIAHFVNQIVETIPNEEFYEFTQPLNVIYMLL